ncbi:MAG: hypothetical protein DYG98_12035 [Haliscomenobacteraceae bacterium CHB4]|nr:hypothetical protein [Saprospiraceae bacterium]MCE7923779.1 hypothetical protein [Haliscomenobacteraceae bacterium CHB4]
MAFRLLWLIFLTCFLSCFSAIRAGAQPSTDLRKDKVFFQKKRNEFGLWLRQNQLDRIFRADSVAVSARKVTLFLRPAFDSKRACDSIQCAWTKLEQGNKRVNGQFFHERLLHKWAFLSEVPPGQAEVVVRCHDPAHFLAKVYSREGKVPVEQRSIRDGTVVDVSTPSSLQGVNTGDNKFMVPNKKVSTVCGNARRYLTNFYKMKGTPILWRAKVDTSYTTYDEFVLEVTHLNYEICPDGFFEYHRIYVKGLQKGNDVELSWEFQGKYGSGIIFPPRKNDYKDMDLRYKSNLEEYQKRLFKKLTDYLRQ